MSLLKKAQKSDFSTRDLLLSKNRIFKGSFSSVSLGLKIWRNFSGVVADKNFRAQNRLNAGLPRVFRPPET